MSDITPGYTFSTETLTPTKLNQLVTDATIGSGKVVEAHIATGAISARTLATDTPPVGSANIADDAILAQHLAAGCVAPAALAAELSAQIRRLPPWQDTSILLSPGTDPNTQIDITLANIPLINATGTTAEIHAAISTSVNITVSGAGGRYSGDEASSTWYAVIALYNPTTDAYSATLAAYDAGWTDLAFDWAIGDYTMGAFVGWAYNGATEDLLSAIQHNAHTTCYPLELGQMSTSVNTLTVSNLPKLGFSRLHGLIAVPDVQGGYGHISLGLFESIGSYKAARKYFTENKYNQALVPYTLASVSYRHIEPFDTNLIPGATHTFERLNTGTYKAAYTIYATGWDLL